MKPFLDTQLHTATPHSRSYAKRAPHPPKNKLNYHKTGIEFYCTCSWLQTPASQTDADFWWTPRALKQATKKLLQSQFLHHSLHERRRRSQGRLAAASWFPSNPCCARAQLVSFILYSLVLHHVHDHPVEGIHVLPNQVLEHDERFHQEILKEEIMAGENWTRKPPRDGW